MTNHTSKREWYELYISVEMHTGSEIEGFVPFFLVLELVCEQYGTNICSELLPSNLTISPRIYLQH